MVFEKRFIKMYILTIKLELSVSCAMQVDGEPWMQRPASVHVRRQGQALVLKHI